VTSIIEKSSYLHCEPLKKIEKELMAMVKA